MLDPATSSMAGDPALLGQGLLLKCSGFIAETYWDKNASYIQTKTRVTKRNCIHLAVL